jgi:multiple sugar transport system ATP-binding protein
MSDSATPVIARVDGLDPPRRGSRVRLRPTPDQIHFFGTDARRIG